ncbi:glutathione S-transferase [Mrakia frigida]|uniref:glutathione S-transferase n=1 Tax=Mrakia frigida TaxID=29902 RepID=UPI003FCBF1F4
MPASRSPPSSLSPTSTCSPPSPLPKLIQQLTPLSLNMSPTISGNYISTCSRRVLVCAYHFGLEEGKDFTFNDVEFPEIKTESWLSKQPFGQMPILEDGNFVLYESRAIARYLVASKGALPTDIQKLALIDQATSVEVSNFDASASAIAFEKVFKLWRGLATDEAKVTSLTATLAEKLVAYEAILSKQKYTAGDELTIADLFHLPYGKMVADLGCAPGLVDGSLPHVAAWWKELTGLPAWARANNKGEIPA